MKNRWNYLGLLLVFLVCVSSSSPIFALTTPPEPTLMDDNPSGAEGDWYVGALPPNYAQKPVLVFVQGKGGRATNWWGSTEYSGTNDMYAQAYNSGYRTAFVNFGDADGNQKNMFDNGAVLSQQIQKICTYYGVSKVNLICHSKGGIDAQTAIVHSGAYPYVANVFTLSTPHWGSQTADLAYSSWAGWLADLLDEKNDATYVLQTGYMSYYRSITDNRSENNAIKYYTIAGTDWGPFLSALYTGGLYLSAYGKNDGLVTVTNAQNPRGTHVGTYKLNHDNIRVGSKVWSYVEPKVRSLAIASTTAPSQASIASQLNNGRSLMANLGTSVALAASETSETDSASGNYLLKGGALTSDKAVEIKIPVESAATSVTFDLLSTHSQTEVKVIAPDGSTRIPSVRTQDTAFFNGATHFLTAVANPKPGYWKVIVKSAHKDAYLLIANYQSSLSANLTTDGPKTQAARLMHLKFKVKTPDTHKVKKTEVAAALHQIQKHTSPHKVKDLPLVAGNNDFTNDTLLPEAPGLYNINLSVEGVLADGTPFARSQVRSLVVDSNREHGVELLQKMEQSEKK